MADLSIKEVCQRLNCSSRTFYRLRKQSIFPHLYKQRGRVYIPMADIDKYLGRVVAEDGKAQAESKPEPSEPQVLAEDGREMAKTATSEQASAIFQTQPQQATRHYVKIQFGKWFVFEREYYKIEKKRFRRFRLFVLNMGISGMGFFEQMLRGLKGQLEQRRALIEEQPSEDKGGES